MASTSPFCSQRPLPRGPQPQCLPRVPRPGSPPPPPPRNGRPAAMRPGCCPTASHEPAKERAPVGLLGALGGLRQVVTHQCVDGSTWGVATSIL